MSPSSRIGIVIVSYGHAKDVKKLVKDLLGQTKIDDSIVVIDNHPTQDTHTLTRKIKGIQSLASANLGFGHGCNLGAKTIQDKVDILMFINPDIQLKPGVIDELRQADYEEFAVVMPRILLTDGRVNANGNVVHTTGLSWCKDLYRPADDRTEPVEISATSGAFFAMSKRWWQRLGGIDEQYFMYYEDTDLSARVQLLGGKQALIPAALAVHDYEFVKGEHKWLYLERNHPLYMIKNWPLPVLIVLLPQNLLVGIGLWAIALLQGRISTKFKALIKTVQALPAFLRARRRIQKLRQPSAYSFLLTLNPTVDSGSISGIFSSLPVNLFFKVNYITAKAILRLWR